VAAVDAGFDEPRIGAFAAQSPAFIDLLTTGSLAEGVGPVMIQASRRDTILPYDAKVVPAWNGLDEPGDVLVEIGNAGHYTFTTTCIVLGGRFQAFLETLSGWDTNGCDPDLLAQEDAVLFMSEYLAAFGRARLFGNECADETLRGRPPVQTISVTVRE